jgi:immune inhibitor A
MPPRDGPVPVALAQAFTSGQFALPAPPALGTQAATARQRTWRVPVILVDFTDQPLQAGSTPAAWTFSLFDSTGAHPTGSVTHYYRWASNGLLSVTGEVVAVVHLSGTRGWYANSSWGLNRLSTPRNAGGVVEEALRMTDAAVDWTPFDVDRDGYVDMLWVLHSGFGGENTVSSENLWSITSNLTEWANSSVFETNDPVPGSPSLRVRINRFSILPELSAVRPGQLCEIGVFAHEFGHALGLPDLYDTNAGSRNVGPGNWSLMSTGSYGTDGNSPEYPSHPGAWPALYLGWTGSFKPAADTLIVLGAIEAGAPVLDLWFQGESGPEHFLVENRQRMSFDARLPSEGLVVYQVDESIIGQRIASNRVNIGPVMGVRLVEADGQNDLVIGRSRGDEYDPFPSPLGVTSVDDETRPNLRANNGSLTNIALRDILPFGDAMRFTAQVRARGWVAPRVLPGSGFTFGTLGGPGPRVAAMPGGGIAVVSAESRGGTAQIVLRERVSSTAAWKPFETVSLSAAAAADPTVAALPAGDLAVAWSDTRHGAAEIYFRVRIAGVWTSEVRLTDLPGSSRSPSIAADDRGGIHLAWLYTAGSAVDVRFLHFPASAPIGDAVVVTPTGARPDAPLVTVGPGRRSYVLWSDRALNPVTLWFARFSPDSGVSTRYRLAPNGGANQLAVAAGIDAGGVLHTAWTVLATGANEIHYQRREPGSAPPSLRDTTLEHSGDALQNPVLALDAEGGVHVAWEASLSGISTLRYKHYDPRGMWDSGSMQVTRPGDGIATLPGMVADRPTAVSLVYGGFPSGSAAWLEIRRDVYASGPTEAPMPVRAPAGVLHASPNPIRPARALQLRWDAGGEAIATVEVLDVSGRRVARTRAVRDGGAWVARVDAAVTATWSAGVYFARVEGRAMRARFVVLR